MTKQLATEIQVSNYRYFIDDNRKCSLVLGVCASLLTALWVFLMRLPALPRGTTRTGFYVAVIALSFLLVISVGRMIKNTVENFSYLYKIRQLTRRDQAAR